MFRRRTGQTEESQAFDVASSTAATSSAGPWGLAAEVLPHPSAQNGTFGHPSGPAVLKHQISRRRTSDPAATLGTHQGGIQSQSGFMPQHSAATVLSSNQPAANQTTNAQLQATHAAHGVWQEPSGPSVVTKSLLAADSTKPTTTGPMTSRHNSELQQDPTAQFTVYDNPLSASMDSAAAPLQQGPRSDQYDGMHAANSHTQGSQPQLEHQASEANRAQVGSTSSKLTGVGSKVHMEVQSADDSIPAHHGSDQNVGLQQPMSAGEHVCHAYWCCLSALNIVVALPKCCLLCGYWINAAWAHGVLH